MAKCLLSSAAGVALLFSAAAVAQPAAQSPAAPVAKVQTRANVQARIAKQFARLDANRDGFVTQAEAQAVRANAAAKRGERAAKRANRAPGALFERLDTNRDGVVTRAEADAARAARAANHPARAAAIARRGARLFERLDTNRDGQIARAEFDAAHAQRQQRIAARDKDGDGRPDARRAGAARRLAGLGGRMFELADANRDGRVTVQEATATALQRFDRADANRDGQLTREERQQARQQRRAQRQRG
jgi:Ca2+-binding EF-hand superfamily protein